MKYRAFISYSHRDRKWGDWLHKALETYRVPKALVGLPSSRGEPVPARAYPVFRDREELPTSTDLGEVIDRALAESRYLIVICSPSAARSRWVNEEILQFKRLGRENRILSLIVAGEPNAADGKPGFTVDDECFPEALKLKIGPDGNLSSDRTEPIAADARPDKDGKTNALLKLLAGLLGVDYDALKRRDETRRKHRQRLLLSSSLGLILLFAGISAAALWQWREAAMERDRAEIQRKRAEAGETEAKLARERAVAAREAADGLIEFMQYDLSNTLSSLGRLSMMEGINERIRRYHEEHPPQSGDRAAIDESARERSVALGQQGGILRSQGRLAEALRAYRDSLEINKRLAEQDPSNVVWQHDVSVGYNDIADIFVAQGRLAEALQAYSESLEIAERLAEQDPENADRQRDLSVGYNDIGEVLMAQGRIAEADQAYRDSLKIFKRLAELDPDDTDRQRDLSVGYSNVGHLLEKQGRLAKALDAHRNSLKIRERLVEQEPDHADWQQRLSIGYRNIGDVLMTQGQLPEALQAYRDSLGIHERLVEQDPDNANWSHNLSGIYDRVGDVLELQGQLAEALKVYRDSLDIRTRLTEQDPDNSGWQRDLSASYHKLGNVFKKQGQLAEARQAYRDSLRIGERLAEQDPDNVVWQRDISVNYDSIGYVLEAQELFAEALNAHTNSLKIVDRLAGLFPDIPQLSSDLAVIRNRHAELLNRVETAAALNRAEVYEPLKFSGRLAPGLEQLSTGEWMAIHKFPGRAGDLVAIDLRSADFKTYLILTSASGERWENDDWKASAEHSRIELLLPENGDYTVVVTSHEAGEIGDYALEISRLRIAAEEDAPETEL